MGSPLSRAGGWAASPRFWVCAGAAVALHGAASGLVWAGGGARPEVVVKSMAVRTLSWVSQEAPSVSAEVAAPLPEASLPALVMGAPDTPEGARLDASAGRAVPGATASSSARASVSATVIPAASPATRPPDAIVEQRAGLPPAPAYMKSAGLDVGPRPLGEIEPEYPESANLQEGSVTVRVLISETGHVDNVAVVRSEPKGLFEQAALEAFAKAGFEPARYAGLPVKSQLTVEVHFLPINRGARISGRGY